MGSCSYFVINCVALNQNILVSSTNYGRVTGSYNSGYINHNYASNDMELNNLPGFPLPGIGMSLESGESINPVQFNNQGWWTTTGTWDTSPGFSEWDFTGTWEWGSNNLPALRNMP